MNLKKLNRIFADIISEHVGKTVVHPKFGKGIILSTDDSIVKVKFADVTKNMAVENFFFHHRFVKKPFQDIVDSAIRAYDDTQKEIQVSNETMKINKAKPTYIRQFTKDYDFLNPYYQHLISYHGITYKNAEAAFQAQKNPKYARQFVSLSGPKARTLGSKVMPLPGWEDKQLDVMEDICRAKFSDEELKQKLIATFPAILINGNTRGEKFWGASLKTGIGRNHLGEILTDIREELM